MPRTNSNSVHVALQTLSLALEIIDGFASKHDISLEHHRTAHMTPDTRPTPRLVCTPSSTCIGGGHG